MTSKAAKRTLVLVALCGMVGLASSSLRHARAESPKATRSRGTASNSATSTANPVGIPAPYDVPMTEAVVNLYNLARHCGGSIGMSIVDLRNGNTVVAKDAAVPMNPASNAKLLTAWAALQALGPQHRYLTGLYGTIREDRVETLLLTGDGDPSLEHQHLYAMVAELRLRGVKMIGDIVVDQSRFDDRQEPPAFEQQPDEWASFRAPVSAIAVDGNTVQVSIFPGSPGAAARIRAVPPSVVDLVGTVGTSVATQVETVQLEMSPQKNGRLSGQISGSIPAGSLPLSIWRRVADPTWLAGDALADACRDMGLEVHGKVRRGHPVRAELLASHRSAPLGQLLHALGKHSDNFYAEMIFKGLGAKSGPASFEAARMRIFELLAEAHLDAHGLKLENGSGLFDADRMSAGFITSLLAAAASDPSIGPEFLAQLAIGGVDGTLRNRFEPFAQLRTIRAKTGSLRTVSALSGYVLGSDARPAMAFSFLVNDVIDAAVALRQPIDEVVAAATAAARLPAALMLPD